MNTDKHRFSISSYSLQYLCSSVFICGFVLFPGLSHASVRVSILSILQPTELTLTLKQPDRAMLRAPSWNHAISSSKPMRITLSNNMLVPGSHQPTRSLSIHCAEDCHFEIEIPNQIKRLYRGSLSLNAESTAINVVLHLSEDELLASIVASEMGEHRVPEALQAFAVVARSFLRSGSRHPELRADFCDLTHCQVFQSYQPTPEALAAVQQTTGLVLTFQQNPFRPYYSRSCGGRTARFEEIWKDESPEYPFTSVICPCNTQWEASLQQQELDLLAGFTNTRLERNLTGIVLSSGTRQVVYTPEEFRIVAGRQLGWNRIRSNHFVTSQKQSSVTITGNGIGHRVGFCQTGAVLLAKQGKAFEEILRHFFPNAEIRTR